MRISREVALTENVVDIIAEGLDALTYTSRECNSKYQYAANLANAAPKLLELAYAFESYLEDNSMSERRRGRCLAEVRAAIQKAESTK